MIEYELKVDDGSEHVFAVDPCRRLPLVDESQAPEWTRLAYQRCGGCPLDDSEHERCPAAVDASEILERFKGVMSYARVDVSVRAGERTIVQNVDVQTALHSLLGLVMATSGCPILARMRPLAHHHLPFASKEETVFRAAGAYLLGQHFVARDGGEPDFQLEGLKRLYKDLQEVNRAFTERIRAAAVRDANLNAVVLLFSLSVLVSFTLDDLVQIREMYSL